MALFLIPQYDLKEINNNKISVWLNKLSSFDSASRGVALLIPGLGELLTRAFLWRAFMWAIWSAASQLPQGSEYHGYTIQYVDLMREDCCRPGVCEVIFVRTSEIVGLSKSSWDNGKLATHIRTTASNFYDRTMMES